MRQTISGWGLYPRGTAVVSRPERYFALGVPERPAIARGLGRSYGDAAMNTEGHVILMERLDRFLGFDQDNGIIKVEAGVSLRQILDFIIPKGWFLPVVPGTAYATVGGCVAADVHGKNHHNDGTFGIHVNELEILLANGMKTRCSPEEQSALFWATIGGMGLTGIITEVTLRLLRISSAKIIVKHIPTSNLAETMQVLDDPAQHAPYSVAWIDCLTSRQYLGRGIVMNGAHALPDELPANKKSLQIETKRRSITLPFHLPGFILNRWTVGAFNQCYHYYQSRKMKPFISNIDSYFFPLDAMHHWNKMYGTGGFIQYQFAVPAASAKEALPLLLREIAESKRGSFLAVLKKFGKENSGMLSFPFEGYTLALDLPVNASLFPFLQKLDALLLEFSGRLYLAKDARMEASTFRKMYPRWTEWQRVKRQHDPHNIFQSDLSRRLMGDA